MDGDEARVLRALDEEPRHGYEVIERAGLGVGRALASRRKPNAMTPSACSTSASVAMPVDRMIGRWNRARCNSR